MFVGQKDVAGLPESLVASAAQAAKDAGQDGKYAFTTQRPSVFPFIQYSPDRDISQEAVQRLL